MRLVDTSAWIEWLAGTPTGSAAAEYFPDRSEWVVPTIVQLELLKWARRNLGEVRASELLALSNGMQVRTLTTFLAERAASLGTEHKLAIADSVIYATAIESGADLVTCDAHFEGLPGVIYIPKKPH